MPQAMYRSIFVPLDGSPFAEQAIPLALDLARRAGAMVQVAMVHHPVPALATALEVPEIESQLDQEARAREQVYLSSIVARIQKQANVPVTSTLIDGAVTEALQAHVEASGADLVVMTTHGRGPMSRFWLGSVADHLMRVLHVPLLLVRPTGEPVEPPVIRRILVSLDGSSFSEEAIGPAVALGRIFGAEYALAMVVEPPLPIADPSGIMVLPVAVGTEEQLKAAATKYLAEQAEKLRKEGLTVTTHQIDGPAAASALLAEAEQCKADVIALASHGAGGFERLVVGSVADKVIRGSTHPTLIVRPPKGVR
jgi:nucleotide-binding universal stress UspA family protein